MTAYLDAVSKAKRNYVTSKLTLEQRLKERLDDELKNLRVQLDIAVRYAHNDGSNKAEILRAMGTKDYHTLYASLKRTEGVEQDHGVNPLDSCYSFRSDDQTLTVTYLNHGPLTISGVAEFEYRELDDGAKMLMALDALWSDDYRTRNDVVAVLDGAQEGFYYVEAMEWMKNGGR